MEQPQIDWEAVMMQAEAAGDAGDWRTVARLVCQAQNAPDAPSFDPPAWQDNTQVQRWLTLYDELVEHDWEVQLAWDEDLRVWVNSPEDEP